MKINAYKHQFMRPRLLLYSARHEYFLPVFIYNHIVFIVMSNRKGGWTTFRIQRCEPCSPATSSVVPKRADLNSLRVFKSSLFLQPRKRVFTLDFVPISVHSQF